MSSAVCKNDKGELFGRGWGTINICNKTKSKVFSLERLYEFCIKKISKEILGPNFDPKKKLKKNWLRKFWVQTNCWSETILGTKEI